MRVYDKVRQTWVFVNGFIVDVQKTELVRKFLSKFHRTDSTVQFVPVHGIFN